MIDIQNVSKKYGDFYALNQVSLQVQEGEFIALMGYSGSGKSTLLNMIGQIDTPTQGKILLDGIAVSRLNETQKAKLRSEKFGFVFQSFYLEPYYTVLRNVELPFMISGLKRKEFLPLAESALEKVGLLGKAKNLAKVLSGGEMQRVAIARAIALNPPILIADEPCGNLDTKNSEIVLQLLSSLHQSGKTILMVTHNAEHAKIANRLITLRDGEVVSDERVF